MSGTYRVLKEFPDGRRLVQLPDGEVMYAMSVGRQSFLPRWFSFTKLKEECPLSEGDAVEDAEAEDDLQTDKPSHRQRHASR